MLESVRADYVIDYAGPATEMQRELNIAGVTFDVLSRQEVYLVLSKRYPEAPVLMAQLEAIAETLDLEHMLGPEIAVRKSLPLAKPPSSR